MTYDWETARPTDLWNFLFMFRFNTKKDLSCVAFLHSSVKKCSRRLWKISASALEHAWRQTRRQLHIGAVVAAAIFLCFSSSATKALLPTVDKKRQMPSIFFNSSALLPGAGLKKRIGTDPELLQTFSKCSHSWSATRFTPYYTLQISLVYYKCFRYGVWWWFSE